MIARVSIDGAASGRLFDYSIPFELENSAVLGARVKVQFGRRPATGYILELVENSEYLERMAARSRARLSSGGKEEGQLQLGLEVPRSRPAPHLKPLRSVDGDCPILLPSLVRLARWMSDYYIAPIERCVQTLLPAPVRSGRGREKTLLYVDPVSEKKQDSLPKLTARQTELLENLRRVGGGWMRQVCKEFSCAPTTIRKLEELGAVTIEEKQVRRDPLANRRVLPTKPLPLNEEQAAALKLVFDNLRAAKDLASPPPKPVLLFGVTGSGKTEVYLQAIAAVLEQGGGAIVLVPEISLTPQTVQRFASRFGRSIAVLHSALSDGERFDEWQRIRKGEARVVIGPRSAVFAPVEKLGLIIVDEEHEPSYKQDESPRYNARDTAVMRAYLERCAVILGSATPSFESWKNAKAGKYALARLSKRAIAEAEMPSVHIVDMRKEIARVGHARFFSEALMDAIRLRLDRGEQTILFLNRRGYATSLSCPSCGYVETCPNCDLPYTYHRDDDCLRCHICGGWKRPPDKCPACGDPSFKFSGFGTQRIERIVRGAFPTARVARMDADSTSRKLSHDDILGAFRSGKVDILIGTQMIAKGLHFPSVTLVGIVMADTSLHIPDFRAGERTFQLLAQVSGRTGRGALAGEVIVQTYTPDHPAVQRAKTEDFEGFANGELPLRKEAGYPPYVHLSCITFSGPDEAAALQKAEEFSKAIKRCAVTGLLVSDVYPAALSKANRLYRFQMLLRSPSIACSAPAIRYAIRTCPIPSTIRLSIDIDAISIC